MKPASCTRIFPVGKKILTTHIPSHILGNKTFDEKYF